MQTYKMTLADTKRYWLNVAIKGLHDCWIRAEYTNKNLHTRFWLNGVQEGAHRVAYYLCYGEFDSELSVCHRFDVPSCCNPNHLFLGTAKTNALDMVNKGRCTYSKIKKHQAIEIRNLYKSGILQRIIADMFSIDKSQVSRIVNNKSWAVAR